MMCPCGGAKTAAFGVSQGMTLSDSRRILQACDGNRLCHIGKCGLASRVEGLVGLFVRQGHDVFRVLAFFDDHGSGDANLIFGRRRGVRASISGALFFSRLGNG